MPPSAPSPVLAALSLLALALALGTSGSGRGWIARFRRGAVLADDGGWRFLGDGFCLRRRLIRWRRSDGLVLPDLLGLGGGRRCLLVTLHPGDHVVLGEYRDVAHRLRDVA